MIYRVYVEKKPGFDIRARDLRQEINNILGIDCTLRHLIRYDFEGDREDFDKALDIVFSQPPTDNCFLEEIEYSGRLLCIENLPGQYDQRADSAAQCVSMLTAKERPNIRCVDIYILEGINDHQFKEIKSFLLNPVECRECFDKKLSTLKEENLAPPKEEKVEGFIKFDQNQLKEFYNKNGFAFSYEDIEFIQSYFIKENRDPFAAELLVLDTYWSDHCRHTTFNTHLTDITIDSEITSIKKAYKLYNKLFSYHHKDRPEKYPSLMDMATIGAKELKKQNLTPALDESEEINACSIKIKADIGGRQEDWTVMFKNETHNHPTEIEPYGGAATCLGGAIRDPLSGRVYVYQSMRISGAGDIKMPLSKTLKGKLPQRLISQKAAQGFSSYGNQIGLATGYVKEIYHSGYVAKRMEVGFVVGAAPSENIIRKKPSPGDVIMLIGGRTGRDGVGGATGSSKAHDQQSIQTMGAEVQKGDPITERKLQRLFKNPKFSTLVKRCNDFGAGGVSVAIGELAAGIDIELDNVPKKYFGLSGSELAISESQERMAVVIDKADEQTVIDLCKEENLECAKVATVTDQNRMRMWHNGEKIIDLSREFLDTSGAAQKARAVITDKSAANYFSQLSSENKNLFDKKDFAGLLNSLLSDYNSALQKGLVEMFDSTIGSGTVLMPFGGRHQLSPAISMAAKLPSSKESNTATIAAYGFNPYLSKISPFIGGMQAVADSVIKTVISGAEFNSIYLTFQEYFEKLLSDPTRWGKPTAALLGALYAQLKLKKAAIGGKDSMSGSFEDLDVPPTLISFALGISGAENIVGSTAKNTGKVYRYKIKRDQFGVPCLDSLCEFLIEFDKEIKNKNILFSTIAGMDGAAAALIKALFGEKLGFRFLSFSQDLFTPADGDIIFSVKNDNSPILSYCECVGEIVSESSIYIGESIVPIADLIDTSLKVFEDVYPTKHPQKGSAAIKDYKDGSLIRRKAIIARPKVIIPVFPGTNCEFDTAKKFEDAGADTNIFVVKNLTPNQIKESVLALKNNIDKSNIIVIPGGFSGGDQPDGSGKFICAMLQNPYIAESINNLLYNRDGLILGICNGFQALIKLGLLPYGSIRPQKSDSPTLCFNSIGRHISQIVKVRVSSNLSPWLSLVKPGMIFNQAVSHGEGRFVANEQHIKAMIAAGQIATQYVDLDGLPTMQSPYNPNGSVMAVEGITSIDGRVFGKMGHSERIGENLYKNIDNDSFDLKIFKAGVNYYS